MSNSVIASVRRPILNYLRLSGVCIMILAALAAGCGNSKRPDITSQNSMPTPTGSNAIILGTVIMPLGGCSGTLQANLTIENLAHQTAYAGAVLGNSSYQTELPAGEYVLTALATPCVFARSFTLSTGQTLVVDVILHQ